MRSSKGQEDAMKDMSASEKRQFNLMVVSGSLLWQPYGENLSDFESWDTHLNSCCLGKIRPKSIRQGARSKRRACCSTSRASR